MRNYGLTQPMNIWLGSIKTPFSIRFNVVDAGSPEDVILGTNFLFVYGIVICGDTSVLRMRTDRLVATQYLADMQQQPILARLKTSIDCDTMEMEDAQLWLDADEDILSSRR